MKHTQEEINKALNVIRCECESCIDDCEKKCLLYSHCCGCTIQEMLPVEWNCSLNKDEGCDLCRSGKQIIVYGVDYAIDTKSEYHRIEPKYCPVCGRILEGKR